MSTPNASGVTPTLSIRGLKKSFGGVQALKGVEIDILPGEVHAVPYRDFLAAELPAFA